MKTFIPLLIFMFSISAFGANKQLQGKVFCDYKIDAKTKDIKIYECSNEELIQIYKRVQASHIQNNSALQKARDAGLFMVKVGGAWFLTAHALSITNELVKDGAIFEYLEKSMMGRGIINMATWDARFLAVRIFTLGSTVLALSYIGEAFAATVDSFLADPENLNTLLMQDPRTFMYYAKQNPQIIANIITVHNTLEAVNSVKPGSN